MIPDYKTSCTKINLDFNKSYSREEQINLLGTNCIFCNNEISYCRSYGFYYNSGCPHCKYYILFECVSIKAAHYHNFNIRLNTINSLISIYSPEKLTNYYMSSASIDLQTLLNKINLLK